MAGRRIAYLCSQYPAVSHTFILREVCCLRQMGLDVAVSSINDPQRSLPELESREAARCFYVKRVGLLGGVVAVAVALCKAPGRFCATLRLATRWSQLAPKRFLKMMAYLAEAAVLSRWMTENRIDHLHVHFANAASTVALFAARLAAVPFSMTVHGPDVFHDEKGLFLREKVAAAAWVSCISDYCRAQLLRLAGIEMADKCRVMRLGVDTTIYRPSDPYYPRSNDSLRLLTIGRAVSAKGGYDLLYAFSEARRSYGKLSLDFVGGGEELSGLQEYARSLGVDRAVCFHGALSQEGTLQRLREADLFILPSYAEGLPIVLMEAMSMAIPCISTYVAGIPELIRNEEAGFLVSPGDRRCLADTLERLCCDRLLRKRFGRVGREIVRSRYELVDNARMLYEQFSEETACS